MKEYYCYLGECEQYRYTIEAKNLKDLRIKFVKMFNHHKNGRWYKQVTPNGYPKGSVHFIIKDSKTYPKLGCCKTKLLIMPA
jgi:hypothetical protein